MPQAPGAPAVAVHVQARVEPAGLGAPKAPPLCCAERPRGLPMRRQKRHWDTMGHACHWGLSPWATLPLERQRFRGYVGRVAHRWPTEKATSGPSESRERPGKAAFSTRNRKNRPRNDKGHKGGVTRPTSWPAWSAQPTALDPAGPPLPLVGALTADMDGRRGSRQSCRPCPCPRYARVAQRADACGVLPRRRSRRACPCPHK